MSAHIIELDVDLITVRHHHHYPYHYDHLCADHQCFFRMVGHLLQLQGSALCSCCYLADTAIQVHHSTMCSDRFSVRPRRHIVLLPVLQRLLRRQSSGQASNRHCGLCQREPDRVEHSPCVAVWHSRVAGAGTTYYRYGVICTLLQHLVFRIDFANDVFLV